MSKSRIRIYVIVGPALAYSNKPGVRFLTVISNKARPFFKTLYF